MEEVQRTDSGEARGVVELGLEICARAGISRPQSLKEAVALGDGESSAFAEWMMWMGMRWLTYRDVLVGMSWLFLEMHEAVRRLEGNSQILSERGQKELMGIARRERNGLEAYRREINCDSKRREEFRRGVGIVRQGLRSLRSAVDDDDEATLACHNSY